MVVIPYLVEKQANRLGYSIFPDLNNNFVSDWLYSEWSEEKYDLYNRLRTFDPTGIVGGYFDYLLDRRDDIQYMDRFGVKWSDVKDPRKLRSSSSYERLGRSYVSVISRNVNRLYR